MGISKEILKTRKRGKKLIEVKRGFASMGFMERQREISW